MNDPIRLKEDNTPCPPAMAPARPRTFCIGWRRMRVATAPSHRRERDMPMAQPWRFGMRLSPHPFLRVPAQDGSRRRAQESKANRSRPAFGLPRWWSLWCEAASACRCQRRARPRPDGIASALKAADRTQPWARVRPAAGLGDPVSKEGVFCGMENSGIRRHPLPPEVRRAGVTCCANSSCARKRPIDTRAQRVAPKL